MIPQRYYLNDYRLLSRGNIASLPGDLWAILKLSVWFLFQEGYRVRRLQTMLEHIFTEDRLTGFMRDEFHRLEVKDSVNDGYRTLRIADRDDDYRVYTTLAMHALKRMDRHFNQSATLVKLNGRWTFDRN